MLLLQQHQLQSPRLRKELPYLEVDGEEGLGMELVKEVEEAALPAKEVVLPSPQSLNTTLWILPLPPTTTIWLRGGKEMRKHMLRL